MADASETRRTSRGFALPLSTVLFVLLLYCLSPGPVERFVYDQSNSKSAIERFYAPLAWACNHIPAVEAFYRWYLPLWL